MPNVEAQYAIGWSFSFMMALYLFINGSRVIFGMLNNVKLLMIKYSRIFINWFSIKVQKISPEK
jgi:uncharacterized protein YybS (DUF2232 family)